MAIGRTSNPALNNRTFENLPSFDRSGAMTIGGTVNKSFVMLALVVGAAVYTWKLAYAGGNVAPWGIAGALGGFVVAMATIFRKSWAPVTAPLYAALEGLALGAISAFYERQFPGIVMQAAALTFAVLFALLAAYRARLIQATENFRLIVFSATAGIFIVYLVNFFVSMFTSYRMPFIHESGPAGILFSLFVTAVAALNLVLDFDFVENGAAAGAPKYMEWYGAFGLTVTLVWLYLEMLRLLSKLRRR